MIDRRGLLRASALAGAGSLFPGQLWAQTDDAIGLGPGEYRWLPERAPFDPVVVIVSNSDQMTFVYRNGVRIGVSTCSTGKPGHRTPTGVFTVLQKRVEHYSSIYNNAPMPYMQRLTWSGIALHAGDLPGYPASAGCVRLPIKFANALFAVTHVGTPVIIADKRSAPAELASPGILIPAFARNQAANIVDRERRKAAKNPWSEPPRVCRRLQLLRDWSHDTRIEVPEVLPGGA